MLPNFNHNAAARTANFVALWEEGDKSKFVGKPAFIVGGASSVGQYGTSLFLSLSFSQDKLCEPIHSRNL